MLSRYRPGRQISKIATISRFRNFRNSIAQSEKRIPPEPDALALAALVVESLDELTPDAIESAAQRARKQRTSG
jgi:hypothetical protein